MLPTRLPAALATTAAFAGLILAAAHARADLPPGYDEYGTQFSNDNFGAAIAFDGETLAIGAHSSNLDAFNGGAVYVYERDGEEPEPWTLLAVLAADEPRPHGQFGIEVAVAGDVMLVSESLHSTPNDGRSPYFKDENRVHVFTRTRGDWRHAGFITPDDPAYLDEFGRALELVSDGERAIISAAPAPRDGSEHVAFFEFSRDGDEWTQEAMVVVPPEHEDDIVLSHAMRSDGETVLVPALESLRVYTRDADGWTREESIALPAASVDVDGDTAIVSAADGLFALAKSGGAWAIQEQLDESTVTWLRHVELDGDTFFLQAAGGGSIPVYTRDGGVWSETAALHVDEQTSPFGNPIVAVGDEAFAGSYYDERNGYRAGAAFRFTRDGAAWDDSQVLVSVERPPEGCGCASTPPGPPWSVALLVLPALPLGRRRHGGAR